MRIAYLHAIRGCPELSQPRIRLTQILSIIIILLLAEMTIQIKKLDVE